MPPDLRPLRSRRTRPVRGFRGFWGFCPVDAWKLSETQTARLHAYDSFIGGAAGNPRNPQNPLRHRWGSKRHLVRAPPERGSPAAFPHLRRSIPEARHACA